MEWFDFQGLLSKGEGNDLMFKKTIESPEDLANTIVHFANNLGGRIIIGIDINNSHLTGTNLNSDWVRTVAKTHCFPAINISTDSVTKNSRDIMIVSVPEGKNKPYVADRTFLFSETFNNSTPTTPQQTTDTTQPELKEIKPQQIIEKPKKEESPKSFFEKINQRQKNTLEYLNINDNITNRKYRELFGISHKTAHLELTALVDKGVLVSKGLGRSTHYILASKDNVPPMIKEKSIESRAQSVEDGAQKSDVESRISEVGNRMSDVRCPRSEVEDHIKKIETKPFIQEELIKEDTSSQIEIKPIIKNNEESTEITIEVKDTHPKIIIHKHSHAKEMLENKILKDTIHRSKDFEKCQAYYSNREEIKIEQPVLTMLKEKDENIISKIDYNKILSVDDETKAKEILQEEKELMANKTEENTQDIQNTDEEEIVKRPKIKEKSELRTSFRNIEKDREKRLNKQQKSDDESDELQYESIDKSEANVVIDNPDVEISVKEEIVSNSENKEIIDDGPDQLGLDSFLSS